MPHFPRGNPRVRELKSVECDRGVGPKRSGREYQRLALDRLAVPSPRVTRSRAWNVVLDDIATDVVEVAFVVPAECAAKANRQVVLNGALVIVGLAVQPVRVGKNIRRCKRRYGSLAVVPSPTLTRWFTRRLQPSNPGLRRTQPGCLAQTFHPRVFRLRRDRRQVALDSLILWKRSNRSLGVEPCDLGSGVDLVKMPGLAIGFLTRQRGQTACREAKSGAWLPPPIQRQA